LKVLANAARVGHNQINLLAKTRTQQQLIYVAELGDIYIQICIFIELAFCEPVCAWVSDSWPESQKSWTWATIDTICGIIFCWRCCSLIFMAVSGRVCGKVPPPATGLWGPGALA